MNNIKAVYLIRNKINNKIYIGQTNDFYDRKRRHENTAFLETSPQYNDPLYVDMRNYGLNNFEFIILEECITQEELYEKEDFYIKEYDSIIDHGKGYNLNYGGKHGKHSSYTINKLPLFKPGEENISYGKYGENAFASKKVINFTTNTIYNSLRECAIKEYGDISYVKPISNVCDPMSNKFTYNNNVYYLLDENENPILKQTKPIKNVGSKGVSVIEKYSNKVFNSISDASIYFNLSTGFIRDRIYNRIKNDKYKDKYCFELYS